MDCTAERWRDDDPARAEDAGRPDGACGQHAAGRQRSRSSAADRRVVSAQSRRCLHPGADRAGAELCAGTGEGANTESAAAVGTASGASQQQAKPGSFLGNLFGHKDEPRPAAYPAQPQQPGYAPIPQYGAPQQYGQPAGYPPPAYGVPAGGGSSFLRSAATTAAGVAAGALAFEGIESLMHGFGHTAGFGGSGLGDFGGRPEETVINNYYDSPGTGI